MKKVKKKLNKPNFKHKHHDILLKLGFTYFYEDTLGWYSYPNHDYPIYEFTHSDFSKQKLDELFSTLVDVVSLSLAKDLAASEIMKKLKKVFEL